MVPTVQLFRRSTSSHRCSIGQVDDFRCYQYRQLLEVPVEIPQVQFLDKFDTIVIHSLEMVVDVPVVLCNGVPQVHFIVGCTSL